MHRVVIASLFASLLLFPGVSFAVTPKPAFFDSITSGADVAKLTDAQRVEYRAYLSAAAIETPGTVIGIDSLAVSINKAGPVAGDVIAVSLSLNSPLAKGYADSHREAADTPKFSLNLGLTDSKGVACAEPLATTFPISDLNPIFHLTTTADCIQPSVSATFSDWNGISLGSWTVNEPKIIVIGDGSAPIVETAAPVRAFDMNHPTAQTDLKTTAVVIISILFILSVSIILLWSFRKGEKQ